MKIATLTTAIMLVGSALNAQGLTPAECEEVRLTYGIISEGCASSVQANTPDAASMQQDNRTAVQIESHVFFPQGGTAIDQNAQNQLVSLGAILQTDILKPTCIQLVGHSDISGRPAVNLTLSERRAKQIADALVTAGLNPQRVKTIKGIGAQMPLTNLPARSPWQRRVSIELRHCPDMAELP